MPLFQAPRLEEAPEKGRRAAERLREFLQTPEPPEWILRLVGSEAIAQDFYMNVKLILEKGDLERSDKFLVGLAAAFSLGQEDLVTWFAGLARQAGRSDGDLQEVLAVVATCTTYNQFYKFLSLAKHDSFQATKPNLRATPFVQSTLGKRLVEILCVGVSTLNACSYCVSGHVKAAMEAGATQSAIEEAVRLTATVSGLSTWLRQVSPAPRG